MAARKVACTKSSASWDSPLRCRATRINSPAVASNTSPRWEGSPDFWNNRKACSTLELAGPGGLEEEDEDAVDIAHLNCLGRGISCKKISPIQQFPGMASTCPASGEGEVPLCPQPGEPHRHAAFRQPWPA